MYGEVQRSRRAPLCEAGRQFLLRPDMTFINHGSFGACPAPVFATYQHWQRELQLQPVEFLGRRIRDLLADAREPLAHYVGAPADALVFVPNTTHGINIIARSLALQPGDEVLGTNHEYGAVARTMRFICDLRRATFVTQPIALPVTSEDAFIEQLWQGVTSRTRVLVVSHITSPTALIFPVAEVCRRARAQGIITIIDGAHAPGQLDLNIEAIGADYYVGNCHKWLCSAVGAGFLYARPERQELLQPLVVSWGWESDDPGLSPFQDYFEWTGTQDPAAYLSVSAAVAFQQEHDWPSVRAACHHLLAEARDRIGALTGLPQISPDGAAWWGQMCALPLPIESAEAAKTLKQALWERYMIEVPIVAWEGRHFVRVSIQAYNSPQDVDRLVDALGALL